MVSVRRFAAAKERAFDLMRTSIADKLKKRSTLAATFFLARLAALELDGVALEEI